MTSAEGIFSPVIERSELGAALLDASTDAAKQAIDQPNFNAIKAIAHSIPAMLTPFFQGAFPPPIRPAALLIVSAGVIKMLLFRRAEPSHKIQAVPTANALALMIKDYLEVLPKPKGKSGLHSICRLS